MAANEDDQQSAANQLTDDNQFSTPLIEDVVTVKQEPGKSWRFKSGEKINLLSDDEGNDDIAGAFAAQAPSFTPQSKKESTKGHQPAGPLSKNESDMQEADHASTADTASLDAVKIRQMALKRQRELADKFREKHPFQQTASEPNGMLDDVHNAEQPIPVSNGHSTPGKHARGKDAAAAQFQKIKQAYFKKKAANTLSIPEEIEFMKAESAESARLRKLEADEEFDRSPSHDDGDGEGLFIPETPGAPSYNALHSDDDEPAQPKKRGRKHPTAEDNEVEKPRKRGKPSTLAKNGKKGTAPDGTESGRQNAAGNTKQQKGPKAKPTQQNAKQKKATGQGRTTEPAPNMLNLSSIRGSNIIGDTAAVADLPDQPGFMEGSKPKGEGTRQRPNALKQLIASVPTGSRKIAHTDAKHLEAAIKDFNGQGSVYPTGGTWGMKGLRASLEHYQVLGAAFMRRRENSTEQPRGGILADEMGLGKTVEMLANITNSLPPDGKKPRATLVIASPALVTQWDEEIRTHCLSRRENKHGIGTVLQHRAGSRITSNNTQDILENADIVLTTYHEVMKSYPKAVVPKELTTAAGKDAWWRDYYDKERGVLHRIKWLRVVLDEAQAIKNHKGHTSMSCRALTAKHYWAITGTPILNNKTECYAYLRLIREPNTGSFRIFCANFCDPDDPDRAEKLNAFLGKIMIRRTHRDTLFGARLLELPKAHEQTIWLEFNEIERQIYEIVKKRFINRINEIAKEGGLEKQYSHIWTMVLRLRQICGHILLIQGTVIDLLEREDFEKLNSLTQNEDEMNDEGSAILAHLRHVLEINEHAKTIEGGLGNTVITEIESLPTGPVGWEGSEGDTGKSHGISYRFSRYLESLRRSEHFEAILQRTLCCGCRQPPQDPQITSCFHIFCMDCLKDLQHSAAKKGYDQARCLECGDAYTSTQPCAGLDTFANRDTSTSTSDAQITKNAKKDDKMDWIGIKGQVLPSAKTRAIKAQILNWLEEDPNVKIIVYTQFLDMVRILSKMCQTEQWPCVKYVGTMKQDARDRALIDFKEDPSKKILLASLKCGGLGLNLTVSSRCICVDPWWNLAVENQAFARILRMGQTSETRFLRLVVSNTIDATLMAVKQRKQVEIDEVMQTKDKLDVRDLMRLFGSVGEDGEGHPFIFAEESNRYDENDPEHVRLANLDDDDEEQFMGNEI